MSSSFNRSRHLYISVCTWHDCSLLRSDWFHWTEYRYYISGELKGHQYHCFFSYSADRHQKNICSVDIFWDNAIQIEWEHWLYWLWSGNLFLYFSHWTCVENHGRLEEIVESKQYIVVQPKTKLDIYLMASKQHFLQWLHEARSCSFSLCFFFSNS